MNQPPDIKLLTAALVTERRETAELRARNAELQASNVELRASDAELQLRVAKLEEQVSKLLGLLGKNSSNSNMPPSSDPPNAKQTKKKRKGRGRGGQKGHRGSHRELLPPEQVLRGTPAAALRATSLEV